MYDVVRISISRIAKKFKHCVADIAAVVSVVGLPPFTVFAVSVIDDVVVLALNLILLLIVAACGDGGVSCGRIRRLVTTTN
ncbi:Hypothetical predicted protein [Octopus vulgaris]|uniref:Uncharacterized protein n=1 Tax=Octopus vulgaris TaxID=6645 RepID=A0AA36ATI1_OCTVU|nr:Hypothetical predicted protein [Octopus vulgaris]